MTKPEKNVNIINNSNAIIQSYDLIKPHDKLFENKAQIEGSEQSPNAIRNISKSNSNGNQISTKNSFSKNNNINEIIINNYSEMNEQIEEELNKKYINQVILLMNDYMKNIDNFSPLKRIILLDWIMSICYYLNLTRKTFYMSVSLIDNCFTKLNKISTDKIQLLGTVCLLISCKFMESKIPSLKICSELTAETYSTEEIKEYEVKILTLLDWNLDYINIFQWSEIILSKWNSFIKDNNSLIKIEGNDYKIIYKLYFFVLDSIILDYYYRFYNMKNLCTAILYLSFGYKMELFENYFLDFHQLKYYDYFFDVFIEKNKNLVLYNFRECIPYVLQFINKDILVYLNKNLNDLYRYENIIFDQDYDYIKSEIAKNAIKSEVNFYKKSHLK